MLEENILDEALSEVSESQYPSFMERMKAIMTDAVIIMLLIVFFSYAFDTMGEVSPQSRMCAFIFVFFLYDPIFVAFFGGTLGHLLMGLKVRRYSDQNKKVFIIIAFFRYAIKVILGIISFLTISSQPQKRAIHDLFTGSIVLYK